MKVFRFALMVFVIVGISAVASGAEFFDGFESYAVDSALHGQGGWKGWGGDSAAGALVSGARAYNGTKSVAILSSSDLVHEFDVTGGLWDVSAMQYIPSGTSGETWFILLNQYSDGGSNDWSMQWVFNLGNGTFASEEGGGSGNIIYNRWVELKFTVDLANNIVYGYYDGEYIGSHQWDDGGKKTIGAVDLYGNGASTIYYDDIKVVAYRKATNPTPADGAFYREEWVSMSWLPGATASSHDIYFGTDYDAVAAGASSTFQVNKSGAWFIVGLGGAGDPVPGGLVVGETYYWRVDEVEADGVTKYPGDVWSFSLPPYKAYEPVPADTMSLVGLKPVLSWSQGWKAMFHFVLFGTDYDAIVNAAPGSGEMIGTLTYEPPDTLLPGTTYYWRVDEAIQPFEAVVGDVWSFTTQSDKPGGLLGEYYSLSGAQTSPSLSSGNLIHKRIDSDINFTWGTGAPATGVPVDGFIVRWLGEITIPVTDTWYFYPSSDDGHRLWINGQQVVDSWIDQSTTERTGKIYLEAGVYPIEMQMYENGGDATAYLRWSCSYISKQLVPSVALSPPVKASGPKPGNKEVDVNRGTELKWTAGQFAVSHNVFFGTDADAVGNATTSSSEFKGNMVVGAEKYDPGMLELGQTYYWRVDEINDLNPDGPWKGNLWSFTVGVFITVDDFEDYNNYEPDRVFDTWIDGYSDSTNGSIAGYLDPDFEAGENFIETSVVHGGRQSMPVYYGNDGKYSYVTRSLPAGLQNWTQEGVKSLSLWYYGHPGTFGSFTEGPTGTFEMTGAGGDIWYEADEFHYAYKRLNGAGSITAKVTAITGDSLQEWAKAGLMIRETLDPNSANAYMASAAAQGVSLQIRSEAAGGSTNEQAATATSRPIWIKLARDISGNFTASYANDAGGAPGTWTALTAVNVQMATNVYIGFALTSHQANVQAQATFSNVSTTGNVTGSWINTDIGIQSNVAEPMFVSIQDGTGQSATVYNTDPDAAQVIEWTEWGEYGQGIALTEFTGVNLNDIQHIGLGFGNPGSQIGGGLMFFDDIRLYKARCIPELGQPAGDLNNNCTVDIPDLGILAEQWLINGPELSSDLNSDETVDFKDYAELGAGWLDEILWP